MDLDDQDLAVVPHTRIERHHVLGSGVDVFDEAGRPLQPQPKTMNKVFSGSTLDLNAAAAGGGDDDSTSPVGTPRHSYVTLSNVRLGTTEHIQRLPKARISVAVIGGGSYTSPHIVVAALQAGYTVRCALVSTAADSTLAEDILRSVPPEARIRLQVLPVNLFSSSSLQEAIRGCTYIIHCGLQSVPPGRDIVDAHSTAVTALFDAVSAIGADRFSRIVLTGSASSVFHPTQPLPPGKLAFDETTKNATASRNSDVQQFAKLKFEEEAWRLQKINRVELSTILPTITIGPSLTSEMSEAMRMLGELARSSSSVPFVPRVYWNFVDVRDVARAHILALESPAAANQRFVVTCHNLSMAEVGSVVRATHPHLKPPTYNAPFVISLLLGPLYNARVSFVQAWRTLGRRPVVNGDKIVNKLGLQLTPFEETVRDAVQDLMDRGFVPTASAVVGAPAAAGSGSSGGSCCWYLGWAFGTAAIASLTVVATLKLRR